jgi:murein DD-endopeptidase MepM/ murein hydrolase activator NlpD
MMKQTKIVLSKISFFIPFLFLFNTALAQNSNEKNITPEEIKKLNTHRDLVADKVNMKMEIAIVDSVRMLFEIDQEEDMSPADELYDGIWNNQYIKVYSEVAVPDSFRIDLTNFVMPVTGKITSPFGPRRRRYHYGTDLKLQVGDTVVAAFEGKVRIKQYEKKGYGYYLVLRHPNGLETVYGHLSRFLVEEGDNVDAGQAIALGGNTGRSTGPHLHFECRFLGQAIDPADIVDFENACTFDEMYVFQKSKAGEVSINNSNYNKYTAQNKSMRYHRIRQGDTLGAIAQKYRVSVAYLCRLNGLKKTSILRVGKVIRCS